MSRMLWFVAGGACGVYTLVKARRTVHAFTPDGIGARVAALSAGARVFADEVAVGMAEHEAELRAQLDLPASDRLLLEEWAASATPGGTASPTPMGTEAGSRSPVVSEGGRDGDR